MKSNSIFFYSPSSHIGTGKCEWVHIHGMMGMIRKSGFQLLAYMYTQTVSSPSFKMMIQTKDGNKKYNIMIDGSSDIIEE